MQGGHRGRVGDDADLLRPHPRGHALAGRRRRCGPRAGPVRWCARSSSHAAYYERWAKTWEFQALLKARPIAGDADLGRALHGDDRPAGLGGGRPRRTSSPTSRRCAAGWSTTSRPRRPTGSSSSGPGGLRDIEFAVQLLQLVHGRSDPSLRVANTLQALEALTAGGYVGREDGASLADAYRFLRTLEHRLQLSHLRRTHVVPDDDGRRCARSVARSG